jgi:hypothetical protein
MVIFLGGAVNAQSSNSETGINFAKNEWNKDWFDVRIVDFPQIGLFYNIDNSSNSLFRVSMPIPYPVLFITPVNVTYASSYWGINGLLMDLTLGLNISKMELAKEILLRFFPVSAWGGIPLSPKGMGIYFLFETVPLSVFNNPVDNYKNIYYGIGINTGIKYIISEHVELEIKYENYFSYTDFGVWNKYIGLTFKYRIFEPGYYGLW